MQRYKQYTVCANNAHKTLLFYAFYWPKSTYNTASVTSKCLKRWALPYQMRCESSVHIIVHRTWSTQFAFVVYAVRVRGLHSSRSMVYAVRVRWSMTSAEPLHDFCSCFTRCSTKLCRTFAEVLQNIMADSLPLFDFFNSLLWSRMMQKPHIYIKFAERNEPLVLTILNKKSGIRA